MMQNYVNFEDDDGVDVVVVKNDDVNDDVGYNVDDDWHQVEEYEDARDVSGHKDCSTKPCQVGQIIITNFISITIDFIITNVIVFIIPII